MKPVAFAVAGLICAACLTTAAKADIEIAVVGPMTGEYAVFGEQMRRGAQRAVADINDGGGVLDDELELFIKDDGCDPIRAVAIANQLPAESVKFVAGHLCSAASMNASRIYTEEGLVQITPASTDPALTERGAANVFRLAGREDQQALQAAELIARFYPKRAIAILHNGSAHGAAMAESVRAALHAADIWEVLYEFYSPAKADYSDLVARLKERKIEVLYVGGHYSEAAVMVRQGRDIGYQPQLIAGDTLTAEEFWQISEGAGEGALMTAAPDLRQRPEAEAVVARFRTEKFEPAGYTLSTYAAVQIWVDAVRIAETTAPDKVIAAMRGTTFKTVIGDITFDAKGDMTTPGYIWYRWSDGRYVPLK